MIGVLIVTHGHLGKALVEAAAMLVNETQSVRAVSFLPGQGIEDLDQAVRTALGELEPVEGVLGLVDLPGGSPARVLGALSLEQTGLELVTGVNLSMVAEVLLGRQSMHLTDLAALAVQSGRDGILDLASVLRLETTVGGDPGDD